MLRPETADDVIALVRRSRAVEDARLDAFLELLRPASGPALAPAAVLGLMVERDLLTTYQSNELAAGRWAGLRVGSYLLLDRLGRGGMGQVFLAEHALLGKRVAVKVLSRALRNDADARSRFAREARAAAAVDHPNVVHVFDADPAHDPPYLVMEYVDGVSLQAAVDRAGPLTPGEVGAVGVQVARGLEHAAAVGLVHRDVKPANLLLDRKGTVKVLDLGIARFEADEHSRQTAQGTIVGTLDYLAPEQAVDSSAVDPRADLYAFGATLYFLLAGHPPFPTDDVEQKLREKQETDPPPVHRLRPAVPTGLSGVVQRLLSRDPLGRFQSAAEAVIALLPFADPGPDFPARLFAPAAGPADPGPSTDPGRDRDPTPLPATRQIVRGKRKPAADPPPRPVDTPVPVAAVGEVRLAAPTPAPVDDPPTVRLIKPRPNPPPRRRVGRVAMLVAAGLAVLAATALLLYH
jgi:serine/threonine-protein kinase